MNTLPRVIRIVTALVAILLGLALLWRPLTGLVVLVPCTVVVITVALALRHRNHLPLILVLGTIAALASGIWVRQVIVALPYLAAVLLAAIAGVHISRGWRHFRGAQRWSRLLSSGALVALAWLAVAWPDVTLVAVAGLGWTSAVILGVIALVREARPSESPRRTPPAWLKVASSAVALAICLALVAVSVSARSTTPTADGFYYWSGPIPEPGTVLKTRPYQGSAPEGASAVTVLYATTYSDGSRAVASAVIAIPEAAAPSGGREILSWQHGTTGVAQECAPSLTDEVFDPTTAIPAINEAMARNWLVVVPDYPGMGTPGRYPYLIGEGEGRSTLDAIRAARNLDQSAASDQVWLWGHSQGGHATLWAGELAATYAPELTLRGVAALSSASTPLTIAEGIVSSNGVLSALATAWVVVPYADEYADISFATTTHPAGDTFATATASRCASSTTLLATVLSGMALQADAPLFDIDLGSGPVRERLIENAADAVVPAPLFLGQGDADTVVPIQVQRDLAAQLCASGRAVSVHEYPGADHMGIFAKSTGLQRDLFDWVDQINAGNEPSTCQ